MFWIGLVCGLLAGGGLALVVALMAMLELSSYYERRLRLIRQRDWTSIDTFHPGRYDGELVGTIPVSAELAEVNRARRRSKRPARERVSRTAASA